MVNYEIGWKAQLLDDRLVFNGNVFRIDWKGMQVSRYDPANIGDLVFIQNAADAEIIGADLDVTWILNSNLTLIAATTPARYGAQGSVRNSL